MCTFLGMSVMGECACTYVCAPISEHFFFLILERLTSKEASFFLRLHLIYLMYDIIHHW